MPGTAAHRVFQDPSLTTEMSDTTSIWFFAGVSYSRRGGKEGPIIFVLQSPVEVDQYSTSATEHLFRCFIIKFLTQPFRGDTMSKSFQLFLSLKQPQPHNPVFSSTIGRWIKSLLTDAGIHIFVFGVHSTGDAAFSSVAKKAGVPPSDMMMAAGWSRSSTFVGFNCKPILSLSSWGHFAFIRWVNVFFEQNTYVIYETLP